MLYYDIRPHNDEPLLLTCLRRLIEGVAVVCFVASISFAVLVIAAWTGAI